MKDSAAAEVASPWALRDFAFGQIQPLGGLRKLDEVVAFLLDGAPGDIKLAAALDTFSTELESGDAEAIAGAALRKVAALQ